jgi:hypothetical protein
MYSCPPYINDAIPAEYRKIAEELFPLRGFFAGTGSNRDAAIAFAEILGVGNDYRDLLALSRSGIHTFLGHFQNNLDLLIQKTWVEKADEARKEKLLDRIPGFIAEIEREDYPKALREFSDILEELAYLFFGAQSHKDDFTEYTLRIDTQMGLFWWYGGQIGRLTPYLGGDGGSQNSDYFKAVLCIGICYLTNF